MIDINKHIIQQSQLIKEAFDRLNSLGSDLTLFVLTEKHNLIGVVTDGDIRRGLLQGKTLDHTIDSVMNKNFRYLNHGNYSVQSISEYRKAGVKLLPVLNDDLEIIKIINLNSTRSLIPVNAVIMAGGRGERLRPLTDSTPKPMLLVGDKPIIEHNIDRLISYGVDSIHICLKYLGNKIQDYFTDGSDKGINIKYISETESLGTIGAVSLIKDFDHDSILLMNSDLLTNIDFEDFYLSFINEASAMSIAAIGYTINVPYAVLDLKDGRVSSIKEKPDYTYFSNAGIYLIKKEVLKYIPFEGTFNATDLIEKLISEGQKVTTYPLLGYWLDIGRHKDYIKAQEDIKHIKL